MQWDIVVTQSGKDEIYRERDGRGGTSKLPTSPCDQRPCAVDPSGGWGMWAIIFPLGEPHQSRPDATQRNYSAECIACLAHRRGGRRSIETMLQQAKSVVGSAARRLGRGLDGIGAALETHPYTEQREKQGGKSF